MMISKRPIATALWPWRFAPKTKQTTPADAPQKRRGCVYGWARDLYDEDLPQQREHVLEQEFLSRLHAG